MDYKQINKSVTDALAQWTDPTGDIVVTENTSTCLTVVYHKVLPISVIINIEYSSGHLVPILQTTQINHPNVNLEDGSFCIDADQSGSWTGTMVSLIWGIAEFLGKPNFDDAINITHSNLSQFMEQFDVGHDGNLTIAQRTIAKLQKELTDVTDELFDLKDQLDLAKKELRRFHTCLMAILGC